LSPDIDFNNTSAATIENSGNDLREESRIFHDTVKRLVQLKQTIPKDSDSEQRYSADLATKLKYTLSEMMVTKKSSGFKGDITEFFGFVRLCEQEKLINRVIIINIFEELFENSTMSQLEQNFEIFRE
jgi:hypothetical protein